MTLPKRPRTGAVKVSGAFEASPNPVVPPTPEAPKAPPDFFSYYLLAWKRTLQAWPLMVIQLVYWVVTIGVFIVLGLIMLGPMFKRVYQDYPSLNIKAIPPDYWKGLFTPEYLVYLGILVVLAILWLMILGVLVALMIPSFKGAGAGAAVFVGLGVVGLAILLIPVMVVVGAYLQIALGHLTAGKTVGESFSRGWQSLSSGGWRWLWIFLVYFLATTGVLMTVGLVLGLLSMIPILGILFSLIKFIFQVATSVLLAVYLPALTVTYLDENGLEQPADGGQ